MSIFDLPYELIALLGIIIFLILILLIMISSNRAKIRRLKSKYDKFMNGMSGASLEDVLENCIDKLNEIIERNRELEYQINAVKKNLYYCVQ